MYEAIAYAKRINQVYGKDSYGGPVEVLKTGMDNLEILWEEVDTSWVRSGNYSAGVYQGVKVQIAYWLVEV